MNLRQGTLLKHGEYRIECELGHGGFGVTYLAVQVGLNRRVAIKEFFMSEYCNRDAETSHVSVPSEGSKELVAKFRSKFIKEAQNIASLKHPHIISIYDVFEDNGTAYYVMEYLDHGSLADVVKRQGRLPEADALRYIRQIADALRYIHARKMNHLDVKPGNILIDEEDHAVLIDFGLSKRYDDEGNQTSTTPVGISHGYAPLEQYKKGGVGTFSPATDVYSLGATLYKLITGSTPPDANDVGEEGLPPFPANVSAATTKAIEQAMQFRRKDRPQSIEEFLALLDASSSDIPVTVEEEDETTKLDNYPLRPSGSLSGPPSHRAPYSPHSARLGTQPTLQGPRYAPLKRDNANIAEEVNEDKESPRVASSSFSFKKLLIPLLACVVAVVVFFGMRACNNHRAEEARLAAIEQHRLDSIAKAKEAARIAEEAARLEQYRRDSIAKVAESQQIAEEKRKEEERIKAAEAQRLAEEKRKEEERIKAEKAKQSLSATGTINGHEYVDLGLSVKWATCNVGASSPSDYGNYYAWGETSTKSSYTEDNYKYYSNDKYVDIGNNISGTKYDAARANWGGTWRMPTEREFQELIDKCTWTWTLLDDCFGYKITGKNGNSIFLPTEKKGATREKSYYWSTTLFKLLKEGAYALEFDSSEYSIRWTYRFSNLLIRPVTSAAAKGGNANYQSTEKSTPVQDESLAVETFRIAENDLTAKSAGTTVYDYNGNMSALIKISTTVEGLVFDGGMIGIIHTIPKKGEVWVYVPQGIKKMSIMHSELGTLRNYFFPVSIEAGCTYKMVLNK